ncbi:MAG: O-acetylhomoserine aminocarboxypropyltransferase/cysteine synthase [Anaeromicrobium sp.]|jgi:O-acetylhomoserine (thiol)-lyase|uniref:O-acetylhomoserine aminocarboxypropyltransferase/cysteine synthase family protein n=1 Tax=Anaeromicrobium sp. TaxID=1929132 RepID=UPI0025F60DFF|nr:O-acetylhomoserine aminocarboxypropyltransferase/cysteine synthase family protein [Anaeromicrobium sp.]MCT4595748.1 O-acetylhomoserine aminocarboxypropyltransferase/cysteine synthase [Anaeromicrobium sp.]
MNDNWNFNTKAVQGTYKADETGARNLPIHQTASYYLGSAERAAKLFDLEESGNIYTRINNPTSSAFEEKVNALEGGVGALATSSGQGAISLALLNICGGGDHIVAASTLYGGTYTLFNNTFKKFGIEVTFVNPNDPIEVIRNAFRKNTKALYGETIGNPGFNVLDFNKFSNLSEEFNVPFIVDNTFATSYLCRPFEHGAHIVVYSATKYIGGHGNSIGGVIVDSGNFNWNNGKFLELTKPDPSYHGMVYTQAFGKAAFIGKARVQLLRDLGICLSPFNSFLFHMGLETLHIRMDRHGENALKLATYLENHEKVDWVYYPKLKSSSSYELAKKYLPNGAGGMLAFGIKGGKKAGEIFIDSVELATLVPNVGELKTLVIHPSSTTHRQLSEEEQRHAGVLPELIRVSVGIEHIDDIIEDFRQALEKVQG